MSAATFSKYSSRLKKAQRPESGIPYFIPSQRWEGLMLSRRGGAEIFITSDGDTILSTKIAGETRELTMAETKKLRTLVQKEAEKFDHFRLELASFSGIRKLLGI